MGSDYTDSDVADERYRSEALLLEQESEDDNTTIDERLKEYTTLYS